ncbi:iron chaperone [Brachybacterium sp. GCM10030267]|uniref:iron chaperone n=1 Tax=unclassified Brachybacterium TaxID=2623841 RepID=UPI00361886B8
MSDHEAYISAAPEQFRPVLEQLRGELAAALPEAREVLKYDMPGFEIGGSVVAGYAAFSRQCGLYVAAGAIASHAEDIAAAGLKATKTGVTFTARKPIPGDLIRQLALASRREHGR